MVYICTHSSSAPTLSSASLFFCNRKNFLSLLLRSQIHRVSSLLPRIRQIYLLIRTKWGKKTYFQSGLSLHPALLPQTKQAGIHNKKPRQNCRFSLMDRIGICLLPEIFFHLAAAKCPRIIILTSQFRNWQCDAAGRPHGAGTRTLWRGFTSSTSISSFSRSFSSSAAAMRTRIAERPFLMISGVNLVWQNSFSPCLGCQSR